MLQLWGSLSFDQGQWLWLCPHSRCAKSKCQWCPSAVLSVWTQQGSPWSHQMLWDQITVLQSWTVLNLHPFLTPKAVTCPFNINFRSDEYEVTAGSALDSEAKSGQAANRGFQLIYFMDGNNCNPSNTANTIGWVVILIFQSWIYTDTECLAKLKTFVFLCSNVFQMSHSCICCNSLACEFMKIYAFVWFPIRPIHVLPFVIAFYYVHIGSWQMFGSPSPVPKLSLRLLLLCGACFYLCLMGISGFLALHVSVLNWGDSKSSIPRKGLNMGLQKKLTIPDHEIRSLLSIKNWNLDGWGYFF